MLWVLLGFGMDLKNKKSILKLLLLILTGLLILICVRSLNFENSIPTFFLIISIIGFCSTLTWIYFSENEKIFLTSAIIFSIIVKLISGIRQPSGVVWNGWAYFWETYFNNLQVNGYFSEIQSSVISVYSQFPATSILYNFISLMSGLNFELIFKYAMPFIYSIIFLVFFYLTLINLGFSKKSAVIGVLLLNLDFIFQRNYTFTYQILGQVFFIILIYLITAKIETRYKILFSTMTAILLFLTHHFSFIMACFFLVLFIVFGLIPEFKNRDKLTWILVLPLIIGILAIILNSSVGENYSLYTEGLKDYILSIGLPSKGNDSNPVVVENIITRILGYSGQLFILLIGLLAFFTLRNKDLRKWRYLWLIGWILNIFFLFIIPWSSNFLIAFQDLRFRMVDFAYLLFIPYTILGLNLLENKFKNQKRISILVIFLLVGVIFSLSNELLFESEIQLASENQVYPYEWEQAGEWATTNLIEENSIISGSYRASYISAKSGLTLDQSSNLERLLNDYPSWLFQYKYHYIAVSQINLQYPEWTWNENSEDEIRLSENSNLIYNSNVIQIYLYFN